MMTDSDKIELISKMIAEFWENSNVTEDSAICLLNSVACVIEFKGKENT